MTSPDSANQTREELQAEVAALRTIEREYRLLLDESSDPIFAFFPDGEYRYVNRAFARGIGLPIEDIIGRKIWDVFPKEEADKRFAVVRWVFENAEIRTIEVRVPKPGGDRYYLTTVKPIFDELLEVISVICISKDITERKHMEDRLAHMAQHDTLTDLPNRALFSDRLTTTIAHARRDKSHFAVFSLDLDHFKPVNDTLGHLAGDLLLQTVAVRLTSSIRESDSAGRIGGDEFLVLLPDIAHHHDALLVAEKIHQTLNEPFDLKGEQPIRISSCIGIALYPEHGESEIDLLKHADAALYHAKKTGRNRIQFFEPETVSVPILAPGTT